MVRALLFDLGGVLVHFAGVGPILKLAGNRISEKEAWDFWWNSEVVQAFEKGKISPQSFAAGLIKALQLDITEEFFLEDFAKWERGPYPGAMELLDYLKEKYLLACLTNNNVIHWETLTRKSNIENKFQRCYKSFELGLLKPNPEFFHYAIRDLQMEPKEIIFLDDSKNNIEVALSLGLKAFHVQGLDAVRRVLKDEGIFYKG